MSKAGVSAAYSAANECDREALMTFSVSELRQALGLYRSLKKRLRTDCGAYDEPEEMLLDAIKEKELASAKHGTIADVRDYGTIIELEITNIGLIHFEHRMFLDWLQDSGCTRAKQVIGWDVYQHADGTLTVATKKRGE